MEYVAKMAKMVDLPVQPVFSLTELRYRQLAAGGQLVRLRLRISMYVGYALRVLWAGFLAPRSSILIVSSNTFYAPLLVWLASRFRRPVIIHWRCDLYPDALVVAKNIREDGLLECTIGLVQRLMNRTCDQVVAVGGLLLDHAETRWGRAKRSTYIDNVPSDETKFSARLKRNPTSLGIHYGGQLGYMHEPDSLAAFVCAARQAGGAKVHFDFRMSGALRRQFEVAVSGSGLVVNGPVSNAEWKTLIEDFEVGLVSLSPGGATVSLPSKIYSMMAGGLAIVAICPQWSDLANIVMSTECGWVINNSPFSSVAELKNGSYAANCNARRPLKEVGAEASRLVAMLLADPATVEKRRQNAVRAASEVYGIQALRKRWAAVLDNY